MHSPKLLNMPVQFTNPQTALIFETDFENDPWIEVGCECNGGKGYQGLLSNVPPMAATELLATKSNLVKAKAVKKTDKQSSS